MKTQIVEQFGLLAGYGKRVLIVAEPAKPSFKVQSGQRMTVGLAPFDADHWDKWQKEVVERAFKGAPPEGIEPPMIQANVAACYV